MKKFNVWFLCFLFFSIMFLILFYSKITEDFENNVCITSLINSRYAGFYSTLFCALNNYIHAKHEKQNYLLDSSEWIYKYKDGWTDYFEEVKLVHNEDDSEKVYKKHMDIVNEYKLQDYKDTIKEFYKYNYKTKHAIQTEINKYGLKKYDYDSIFIRRGDKLVDESVYIREETYIDLLLKKNPDCKKIYLQTDDYNSFLKISEIIKNKNLNIEVLTLCDKNKFGSVHHKNLKEQLNNNSVREQNKEYVKEISNKLNNSKTTEEMNPDEIYKHTIDLLIGVDIVLNSNICVTDYQSNTSRFIKLAHNDSSKVFDVLDPDNDIDYNKIGCPVYSF